MMTEKEIREWVRALSKKERLILATYEGGTSVSESMERIWNAGALESLVMQDIIRWTMAGYELTEDGVALAGYIHRADDPSAQHEAATRAASKKTGTKQIKFGAACPVCQTEIVKITRQTLKDIIEFLAPNFHSVSQRRINGKSAYLPICPQCDADALGIDSSNSFPFIMKNGQETEIQSIASMLWIPEKPFCSKDVRKF
jgi:hypothetical protein